MIQDKWKAKRLKEMKAEMDLLVTALDRAINESCDGPSRTIASLNRHAISFNEAALRLRKGYWNCQEGGAK